jgi:hypothetical protein
MRKLLKSLVIVAALFGATDAHAFATIQIQNNTGKTVIESGDVVQVLIQHSLDEQFSEIYFGTPTVTIYRGGWNDPPFITKMNSSDGQKYDVVIEFTVPHDFTSYDSSFLFSARLFKNGGTYTQAGHQRIAVRGISKAVAPVDAADVNGAVNLSWVPVYGASQYHFELVRFINSISEKDHSVSAAEIALDTLTETNALTFYPGKTGKYSWVVRAKADDVWGGWSPASTFNVLTTARVKTMSIHKGIRFYPLPAQDILHIESSIGDVNQVFVFNMLGKQVLRIVSLSSINSIDVHDLAPGLYHVRMKSNASEMMLPFIKHSY